MLRKFILHKISQLIVHSMFWGAVLLFYTYFFGFKNNDFSYVLSFSLFLMPITIATIYVFIYKIIPDYLISKRYFLFGLYSLYVIIISSYLVVFSVFFALIYLSKHEYSNISPISKNPLFVWVAVYLIVFVVCAFKLLKLNLKQVEETKKLATKILETQLKLKEQELHYLKKQIHPHFLFNTLNTMYGFALKKADETPEMILKLSNLLDYLLYQVDKPFVLLSNEINHINDYIELEKMRFNQTLNVDFKVENNIDDLKIAPMLLIPFIENSFKHGVLNAGMLRIKIRLKSDEQAIYFYIENTSSRSEKTEKGIGLENIKKRLKLLYNNQYNLEIIDEEAIFKVNLKINKLGLKS